MFATLITVALFAASNVAGYTLSTPKLVQCQEATITWDGASGAVNLIAVPASDVCNGNILADLGDHTGNSATWKVDVPAGTKLVLTTLDSADVEGWSGEITVEGSDDSSCLQAAYQSASSSSAAPSSSADASSSSSASASSSAAAGTLVVTPSSSATKAASTGTSSSSNSNGNGNIGGPIGGVASDPLSHNGALTHATKPMLILGAISAVLAASL